MSFVSGYKCNQVVKWFGESASIGMEVPDLDLDLGGQVTEAVNLNLFIIVIKIFTLRKRAPTPAVTCQPASKRPSTNTGWSKKQRRRYRTTNQCYLAVHRPKTRAILTGKRRRGRRYHRTMQKMWEKRRHRAIFA